MNSYLLFIYPRETPEGIYTAALPNPEVPVEAKGITSRHCLKINFEEVAPQNLELTALSCLVSWGQTASL